MPSIEAQGDAQAPLSWSDARALAYTNDPKYLITSPNMDFVPSPFVGIVEVSMRADYRYGAFAPIWWTPLPDDFEYVEGSWITCLGLLRRQSTEALNSLVDELSRLVSLRDESDSSLSVLHTSMLHCRNRLRYFPCTFRDAVLQVHETQRYWLLIRAYLDYENYLDVSPTVVPSSPVRTDLMGAFTTDPGVVQLFFNSGIPVWFIRSDTSILADTIIRAIVPPTSPVNVCLERGPDGGLVLYKGLCGQRHILETMRFGHTYLDISRTPLLAPDVVGGYPPAVSQKDYKGTLAPATASRSRPVATTSRSQARFQPHGQAASRSNAGATSYLPYARPHPTQVRSVNKFQRFDHPWMPAQLDAWRIAMDNVDLSQPARPNSELWGYWIPEPALLLRPTTDDRRNRYIQSWLRLRPAWLYLLRLPGVAVTAVPTQWWRDVLYGSSATNHPDDASLRKTRRWEGIQKVFGSVFQASDFHGDRTGPVWWLGRRVPGVVPELCPGIMWEMMELGFHYELLALDRVLVPERNDPQRELKRADLLGRVFPAGHLYSLPQLPPPEGAGLCSRLPYRRVPYLEALRQVLSRWADCPASICHSSPISTTFTAEEIRLREVEMSSYYVNTFFAHSGRAPIVPYEYPVVP
ncbi:hypothetical protein L226DRAFT_547887 [Lentinus tigrinus ALCF2SS1-7]|uniref:Uncharacterized protein n=1 Tax=Lentinus tigrinus ALCF2SS1-6 TaxID=1328759 RepID=A0A5C2RUG2_9APHY|nr:hypothetical protein L227DRAFT_588600 [Lentinus tigrinus ALCF2SS1-6]RPD70162.1 hypothetical protein L226DRAFT_547887 [Lentinus tigrinus ALCF2SS1-7]